MNVRDWNEFLCRVWKELEQSNRFKFKKILWPFHGLKKSVFIEIFQTSIQLNIYIYVCVCVCVCVCVYIDNRNYIPA
jgi:hypothetical protein